VALCLNAQLVVSTTDPTLRSLVRRVPLAESEPKRPLLVPSDNSTMAQLSQHRDYTH